MGGGGNVPPLSQSRGRNAHKYTTGIILLLSKPWEDMAAIYNQSERGELAKKRDLTNN